MRTTCALLALVLTLLCFEVSAAKPRKNPKASPRKTVVASKLLRHKSARVVASQRRGISKSQSIKGKKGRTYVARSSRPPRQASPSSERYIEIQKALAAKGFDPGSADGTWNSDALAALKRFQEANNLKPDGKLGALTLIALGLGPRHEGTSTVD